MIRFNNDYNRGAHPLVLDALARTNGESYPGYGLDPWCARAADLIREKAACPQAAVHFLTGGTQANFTVIAATLRPYQSVVSADTGHINVHETGAVEHAGHKVQALPGEHGKITAAQVEAVARDWRDSTVPEHVAQPKMVYLSYPTEVGTLYSLAELEAMRAVCDAYGLYLFIDGARLGYGLGSPEADVSLADIARVSDVFYLGGTKCGALFGEAVVVANPALDEGFRSNIKQNGGMLAKGWLSGLQFAALLEDDAYFRITAEADVQALRIRQAFRDAGVPEYETSPTNQQFVVLTEPQMAALGERYAFEYEQNLGDGRHVVRFCTSWGTTDAEVDALVQDIARL